MWYRNLPKIQILTWFRTSLQPNQIERDQEDKQQGENSEQKQEDPESEQSIDAEDNDFVFFSTFHILEKCWRRTQYEGVTGTRVPIPTVVPIGLLCIRVPEILSMSEALAKDDQLLSQVILEMMVWELSEDNRKSQEERQSASDGSIKEHAVQDMITKLILMGSQAGGRPVGVAQVFAAQILLDILKLDPQIRLSAYDDLLRNGSSTDALLGIDWSKESENGKISSIKCVQTFRWLTDKFGYKSNVDTALALSAQCASYIKVPFYVHFKQTQIKWDGTKHEDFEQWRRKINSHGTTFRLIVPSADILFLFRHHPIYIGLESLRLTVELQAIATNMTNYQHSFAIVAHLYNALGLAKVLKYRWPQMERAIDAYRGEIFKGGLPNTAEKCQKRFLIWFGMPLNLFARNARRVPDPSTINADERKMDINPSEIIEKIQRYLNEKDTAEKFIANVGRQVTPSDQSRGSKTSNPMCSIAQSLTQLRDHVQQELLVFDIDLITMEQNCTALLSKIMAQLPEFEDERLGHGSIQNAYIVSRLMNEMSEVEFLDENKMIDKFVTPHVQLVADIFDEFLAESKEPSKPPAFDVLTATSSYYSDMDEWSLR